MPQHLSPRLAALLELCDISLSKQAFLDAASVTGGGGMPGGDPSMGGGMPPGMDPSMMGGGMPPGMDPSMMGGDPSMMGGGMPPAVGGPPSPGEEAIQATQQQAQSPTSTNIKVDTNATQLVTLKLLARIVDGLGIHVPASEMVVMPDDLKQLPQKPPKGSEGQGMPAVSMDPGAGAADPSQGGGAIPPISPIDPMHAAGPVQPGGVKMGEALRDLAGLASAVELLLG